MTVNTEEGLHAGESPELASFRVKVIQFLNDSVNAGLACPAFGAIMPPAHFDAARAWQRHCFDHGFAGVEWPSEYGGQGLSPAHGAVWDDECARAGVTPWMNFQGVVLAGPAIMKFGTHEQKDRYLSATLSADIVWCQLFSEPDAGSDLGSLTTKAVSLDAVEGSWQVTGQKVWSSTAQLAQHAILLARTSDEHHGSRGISFFLLDMAESGVDVRPLKQMTGDHEFCEVFLDNAHVPADGLLGPLHGGWAVTTSVLADERSNAGAAGIALQRRLDGVARAGDTGRDRPPPERDRLAGLQVSGGALGRLLERSGGDAVLGPLTKLGQTELSSDLTRFAVDSQGPAGMLTGKAIDDFLYAPGMRVAGGTSEIQRNLIGERLLGLPREPKPRS